MNEKLLVFWQNIEANLRVVTISVFIVLLLIVVGLKSTESVDVADVGMPAGGGMPGGPAGKGGGGAEMTVTDPAAEKTRAVIDATRVPITSTEFAPLVSSSMFDVKAVQNAVALEAQANQRFEEAVRLNGERKYRDALEVCKEVLTIRPGHLRAQELKSTLEDTLKGAGVLRATNSQSPSVTPSPPLPGVPGAGGAMPPGGRR